MLLSRTRSNAPGHIAIDNGYQKEVTSGSVGNDGRFRLSLHHDTQGLAEWCRNLQKGLRRPRGVCASASAAAAAAAASASAPSPASSDRTTADHGPKPRLNIAIHIVGSRGDVQPFIPIAQMLSRSPYGYRVRICTHPVFKDFVESQGIEFFSIGGDPEALMAYMVKNPGLLPNRESFKAGDVGKRRSEMSEIINGCWRSCIEAGNGMGEPVKAADVRSADDLFLADAIIANPPSMAHIHCAEKLGIPLHMVFTMPWSPTDSFCHPLAAMSYGGPDAKTANFLSFVMMELLTWQGLGDLINKFRRQKLNLDPVSPMWGFQLLSRLHVSFTYLWSKSLIPKPADWGSHINITGFSFLPLASSYTPPPDLTEFLQKGPPPIYIGFGSIVVDDSDALTHMLFEAVKQAGVRAIISKGWSKVGREHIPDDIYMIGNCPHDWLFQHVSAVVHHGGAGTTAAGIAAGRPTVVVPFFGDQPFWGRMVARAGAGPEPVPFKELTIESMAASISFTLQPAVQVAAQEMAKNIGAEDGAADTAKDFQDHLALDQFECELCPGRLAVHRHKKTGLRLSGFAVCCLIDKDIVRPNELKILRHKRWYVDEGAEHPLVGLVAAFTGSLMSVAAATSDYAHALKSHPPTSVPDVKMSAQLDLPTSPAPMNKAYVHDGLLKRAIDPNVFTPKEMEYTAQRMAKKSLKSVDPNASAARRHPSFHDKRKAAWHAREQGKRGRAFYVTRATGRYATELTKAGLKAPVAFFYNTANGFHNFPSYGFAGVEVRCRDQITGLGSGVRIAGEEFTLGMWEAFSGTVMHPYKSIKEEGAKGIGKGIWRGGKGFFSNLGAAVFGLPGYTLKGVEKELQKYHLTKTKAEIILIRLRQGIDDFRRSTPEEREEVVRRWNART